MSLPAPARSRPVPAGGLPAPAAAVWGLDRGESAPSGRWELLRALGALSMAEPPASEHLAEALELPAWSRSELTHTFVLELPPYESIHLGSEGKLGGEGADRVAGVWRTLGLSPPVAADHLGVLLALYAELGEAAGSCRSAAARRRLDHVRTTLLWEHLWSWVPGYLEAVSLRGGSGGAWARLTAAALAREAVHSAPARALPLALREAPVPLAGELGLVELADAVTVPVRAGFLLLHGDIAEAAGSMGLALRRGERRFVLEAMLAQSPAETLSWMAGHARRWASIHRRRLAVASDPGPWWCARAAHSARVLAGLAGRPAPAPGSGDAQ